jgi:hypothetical protein
MISGMQDVKSEGVFQRLVQIVLAAEDRAVLGHGV